MSRSIPWLADELRRISEQGLLRLRQQVSPLPGGWCLVNGRRLRNFSSNDYLSLAHDPRVIAAARYALEQSGAGATASALVSGRSAWHVCLEERLAAFEEQEAALLFPTGYAANAGTIAALAGPGDTVFCDRMNHASLVDGCRLSGARLRVFRHDDLSRLERELRKAEDAPRRLIVTDALFSMDGDAAPLPELCELSERYDAPLLVDEAHGTGVFGRHGRGVAEWLGVEDRVAVRVGTLSKAVGALGGFVAGPRELIDFLWNRARPQMFSTALPPAVCAAASATVELIEQEPERREHLLALSAFLRSRLAERGIAPLPGSIGPIIPVVLQTPEAAVRAASALEDRGVLVAAIRPPTVPEGTSRLRITLNAAHTREDVDVLVEALSTVLSLSQ